MKKYLDASANAVVIVVGILLSLRLAAGWQSREPQKGSQIETVAGLSIPAGVINNSTGTGRVAVIEFSDFECPFCERYATAVLPTIRRAFVDTQQVRYVSFQYPLEAVHKRSLEASVAAECALEQGRYWDFHDRLFAGTLSLDTPLTWPATLGLDLGKFGSCKANEALARVRADQAEGDRLRITGTPALFLGITDVDGAITLRKRITGVASVASLSTEIASLSAAGSKISAR